MLLRANHFWEAMITYSVKRYIKKGRNPNKKGEIINCKNTGRLLVNEKTVVQFVSKTSRSG